MNQRSVKETNARGANSKILDIELTKDVGPVDGHVQKAESLVR
jgi:hypothetical protein